MTVHTPHDPAQDLATVVHVLRMWAERRPDGRALAFVDSSTDVLQDYSFARLERHTRQVAARLSEVVRPGDRAVLVFPPGPEFVAAFFGCLYAGVVAVPVSPPESASANLTTLQTVAENAEARVVVSTRAMFDLLGPALDSVPVLGATPRLVFDACVASDAAAEPRLLARPESVAFLQYTSGSTGRPRGVEVTHRNLVHNERMIREAFEHDSERSVFGSWLPLYHDMGLIGMVLQPMYLGVPLYLLSPRAFLKRPLVWLKLISRYKVTTSGGPSFAYGQAVRRVRPEDRAGLDLGSWDVAFNGAEPVREDVLDRFVEAYAPYGFRREAFFPVYGLAEATLLVSAPAKAKAPTRLRIDRSRLERGRWARSDGADGLVLVGCGHARAGQEIAIVDPETCRRCPHDGVGEIWVRGSSVAAGYHERPEDTGATFAARIVDEDGVYLRTGDLGFVADGELFITGRWKDVLIVRACKHHAEDVERTVERTSNLIRPSAGAAFSIEPATDGDGDERVVVAYEVDARRSSGFDAETLSSDIREAVSVHHGIRVHEVAFLAAGAVPRTTSGKVRRRTCRAMFLDGSLKRLDRAG